jgi:HEAT repeat protein
MTCEECRKHLIEHAIGDLTPEVARAVTEHMRICAACAAEAAGLRESWEALGSVPEEQPGPAVRSRFYAMLDGARAGGFSRSSPWVVFEGWLEKYWPRRPGIQFAAAVLLLAAGLLIGRLGRPVERPTAEIDALKTEVAGMQLVMSAALQNQFASVDRLQAIDAISRSAQVNEPVLEALIKTLDSDPSVNVRLATVDALSRFLDRKTVIEGMGRSLANQSSPMVQISLIDALAGAKDRSLLQPLRDLTENERIDPGVRQYAQARLEDQL